MLFDFKLMNSERTKLVFFVFQYLLQAIIQNLAKSLWDKKVGFPLKLDLSWVDLIWFDLIWFDLIWFDLIWFDLIWFDLLHRSTSTATPCWNVDLICSMLELYWERCSSLMRVMFLLNYSSWWIIIYRGWILYISSMSCLDRSVEWSM